jgi:zinc protease
MNRAQAPQPGPVRPFHFPAVESRTLANGLRLLVAETHRFPLVSLELVMNAGGAAEEEARGGVASLTAGLLESGAGGRTADEIAETADGLGLSLDSSTGWDVAQAGFTALRARMEDGMALLADLVRRPTFPRQEVERLVAERLGTLANRRSDPAAVASELFNRYAFAADSPFSRPLAGSEATVRTLGRGDVAAFHAARFAPAGSTLVAAGAVAADELAALAERFFGDWRGESLPAPVAAVKPRSERAAIVIAHRPGAVQSELRVGHVGVERGAPDYIHLLVLNTILGGSFSSRLNMNLRERLGYTYGVSSAWNVRRQAGSFSVSSAVQSEVTAHAVEEILREIRQIREAEVSPDELRHARDYLAGLFPLTSETTSGVATRLAAIATYGLPADYYQGHRERILSVTAGEVLEGARRRLHPDGAAIVVAGDADQVRAPLEALGIGPVEVVDPAAVLV